MRETISIDLENVMHFLGKLQLLWFLCLCLFAQARFIHRREVESSNETARNLAALRSPQKYIIKPIQTIAKVSNNSEEPSYDAVDFGFDDELNQIETKIEDASYELLKELEGNNDKSAETEDDLVIEIDNTQLEETLDKANIIPTENEKNYENVKPSVSSLKNNANNDENKQENKTDFIKVETNMDSENNLNYFEQKIPTERNIAEDKETEAPNFDKQISIEPVPINTDKENDIMSTEKLTPTNLVKETEAPNLDKQIPIDLVPINTDKENDIFGTEKLTPTNLVKETEAPDFDKQISIEPVPINTDKENNILSTKKLTPTNLVKETEAPNFNKQISIEPVPINADKEHNILSNEKLTPTNLVKETEAPNFDKQISIEPVPINTDKENHILSTEKLTPTNLVKETVTMIPENLIPTKLETSNGNQISNLEEIFNKVIVTDTTKPESENSEKVNENVSQITETINKISTSKTTDLKETETGSESAQENLANILATQTTTESSLPSITAKLNKTSNTATQTKPSVSFNKGSSNIIVSTSASPTAATPATTTIKPLTVIANPTTSRPSVPFISQRPIRPFRLPTTRPTETASRPSTTRRPTTSPGWFPNFLYPPRGPFVPTIFINPFNTISSTTEQRQSPFGFGIFPAPWSRGPNFTSFFRPYRLLETPPPVNDAHTPTEDLASWNASFQRGYTKDTGANKRTNIKVNKAGSADVTPITGSKQATKPANTHMLHLHFRPRYSFLGQIVQSPGKKLNSEVVTTSAADKIDSMAKTGKSAIDVKEPVKAILKETDSDLAKNESELKSNEKASLMFDMELPKPFLNIVKLVMDTFRL